MDVLFVRATSLDHSDWSKLTIPTGVKCLFLIIYENCNPPSQMWSVCLVFADTECYLGFPTLMQNFQLV